MYIGQQNKSNKKQWILWNWIFTLGVSQLNGSTSLRWWTWLVHPNTYRKHWRRKWLKSQAGRWQLVLDTTPQVRKQHILPKIWASMSSGQIITTSHDLTPKGSIVFFLGGGRLIPFFFWRAKCNGTIHVIFFGGCQNPGSQWVINPCIFMKGSLLT